MTLISHSLDEDQLPRGSAVGPTQGPSLDPGSIPSNSEGPPKILNESYPESSWFQIFNLDLILNQQYQTLSVQGKLPLARARPLSHRHSTGIKSRSLLCQC